MSERIATKTFALFVAEKRSRTEWTFASGPRRGSAATNNKRPLRAYTCSVETYVPGIIFAWSALPFEQQWRRFARVYTVRRTSGKRNWISPSYPPNELSTVRRHRQIGERNVHRFERTRRLQNVRPSAVTICRQSPPPRYMTLRSVDHRRCTLADDGVRT